MSKLNNMGTFTQTTTGGPGSNGVYVIRNADGVNIIGLKVSSGASATILGAAKIGDFGISTAITIDDTNNSIILSNPDFIDNLTITVTAGTIEAITNQ